MSALDAFREALTHRGLVPPVEVLADGKLHRCDASGKNGRDDGAYIFHADGRPAGGFQNWQDGAGWETWSYVNGHGPLTSAERAALAAKIEADKRAAAIETKRRQAEAAKAAAKLWHEAKPGDHPYLDRKMVPAAGARVHDGRLVIPIRNKDRELRSLQFIMADGKKLYLPDGEIKGCYFPIGKPADVICIGEGFATMATVHKATGHACVVAFQCGNVESVANVIRVKFPRATIVLCADDDHKTTGNPGLAKATVAARAVNGRLAVPVFPSDRADEATDFNDMAASAGLDAVSLCIASAIEKQEAPAQAIRVAGISADEWQRPEPLPAGLPPVAEFDFLLLPETLRPWAEDICERVQCPGDYVGASIMAALGSLIGRQVSIRPQQQTDWTVFSNQWAILVGRPGLLKSPAMEAALSPLKRLQSKAVEEFEGLSSEYDRAVTAAKLRSEARVIAAKKRLVKDPAASIEDGELRSDMPEAPVLARYLVNDCTAQALAEIHRQNPNGLLVHRDEMVSLLASLDREDNAEARGFYLTGWAGDSSYIVDRIGRGMNLHVPAVCLSLLGSTQPGRLSSYLVSAVRGGSGDDGLVQRFGLLVWPDVPPGWRDVDRWPNSDARQAAFAVFERLAALDAASIGAQQDEYADTPYLRFGPEAFEEFRTWRETLESRLRGGDLQLALESHLAKYRKLVPGLALTLHLSNGGTGPVGLEPTLQALAWAEYLETHAVRAYASVTSAQSVAARALLQKIRTGAVSKEFSAREVYRHGWASPGRP